MRDLAALGGVLFAVLLSLFVAIGVQIATFNADRQQQQEIEQVKRQLEQLAAVLKSRIYANIYAVSGVKSLVAMNPELTQEDFSRAMAVHFNELQDLRNIGLARDLVLGMIYPIEGNEAAIGLDYRNRPEQLEAVVKALELNQIIVAGPLTLVQGGTGLVARIPIYVSDAEPGEERFWGFASVVMDAEAIFSATGINNPPGLRLAIRGRDGRGEAGEIFYGDAEVFANQPVTQKIELPVGSWQMAALPQGGWSRYAIMSDWLIWIFFVIASAILVFTAAIIGLLRVNRRSSKELEKERDLFAAGPVFTLEWAAASAGFGAIKYCSSNVEQILGFTPAEMMRPGFSFNALIHPDDRPRIDGQLRQGVAGGRDRFEASYRLQTAAGHVIWCYNFIVLVRNAAGRLSDIRGYLYDQTAQKETEAALDETLQRFNDLVAYVAVGVYVFWHRADGSMGFEYVSDSWCAMTRLKREEVLRNPHLAWGLIHPDEFEGFKLQNQQGVHDRSDFSWEGRIVVAGSIRYVLIESRPIFFANGDSRWFGYMQDISDRKQAEAELQASNTALEREIAERRLVEDELKIKSAMLERISMQDGLTGISNRRFFNERAENEWRRVQRTEQPLSLLLMDIDHFKQYNDHYGHTAGDDCLQRVAQALAGCSNRPFDVVARYGGEEFVALLPSTAIEGALHIAEEMRLAVMALAIPHALSSAAEVVSLSIGVASHAGDRPKGDLRQLQEAADTALYCAKHQGRNRVMAEQPPEESTPVQAG
jgi:diguanylate cyclase (GGDEF)-like protein/PAS domain S-box-containing protein